MCGPDNHTWLNMQTSKLRKLKDIKRCLLLGKIQARLLAKICGQAVAMSKAILPGKLKLRYLYSLLATKRSWNDILTLSSKGIEQLNWWQDRVDEWNGSPLYQAPIEAQVWTDSSSYGWGCVYDQLEASGIWDCETIYEHINFKELLTVLYALICFKSNLSNKTVQFLCDNSTAVAYVKNMGGPIS